MCVPDLGCSGEGSRGVREHRNNSDPEGKGHTAGS